VFRFDETLISMIEVAKSAGYMTYQQVDEYLPDEGGNPRMVEDLILLFDETGLDLKNDPDAPNEDELPEVDQQAKKEAEAANSGLKPLIGPETSLSSRDPIRMYLSQMGNIPLLTRSREIFLAKTIEITRKRFRRTTMESDFALNIAIETLEKVAARELPFERTLRTSDTENARKEQIEGRMPINLPTLRELFRQNAEDWEIRKSPKSSDETKEEALARMNVRRQRLATLCEELSIRTQRLQPVIKGCTRSPPARKS
jgi:RNA polymerase primary sigma factor